MAQRRHLQHAPIAEALIDFRVKARSAFHAESFLQLQPRLAERFPKMQEQRGMRATFQVRPAESPTPVEAQDFGLQGVVFWSADGLDVAQFRLDGFTLNRLAPYSTWEEIFPTAMQLWSYYSEIAIPELVTRLALRYINRIQLPPPPQEIGHYLAAPPVIPPELPQLVSSFLTRVVLRAPETGLAANVTQTLQPDNSAGAGILLLDIDVYRAVALSTGDPAIPETLQALREFKNQIFFGSITETTARMYE